MDAERQLHDELKSAQNENEYTELVRRFVERGDPTHGTKLVRYSHAKRVGMQANPVFARIFKPPPRLVAQVKARNLERHSERTNIIFDKSFVVYLHALSKRITAPEYQCVNLLLNSGRRFIEVTSMAFDIEQDFLLAQKLAKKGKKRQPDPYLIDVLFLTPIEWYQLQAKLREQIKTPRNKEGRISLEALRKRVNRLMGHVVDEVAAYMTDSSAFQPPESMLKNGCIDSGVLVNSPSGLSAHKLRGMYANYMYNYDNRGHRNKQGYIKDVLHLDTLEVATHYAAYEMTNKANL